MEFQLMRFYKKTSERSRAWEKTEDLDVSEYAALFFLEVQRSDLRSKLLYLFIFST